MEATIVDMMGSLLEIRAASGTDVPADIVAPDGDGEDIDEDEGEGDSSGGEGGSETNGSICCSSSSLTLSTVTSTSASNSKTPSGPGVELELSVLFLTLAKLVFRNCPGRVGTELVGDAVNEKSQESIVPCVIIEGWRLRRS